MGNGRGITTRNWRLDRRNLLIPLALVLVTIIAGTFGTYQMLLSHPAYQDASTFELVLESAFTSVSFLVLNAGPYPIPEGQTPLLVYIGRGTGVLFFSYAAVLGFAALFADRLKPTRISLWHARDALRDDSEGHVIVCGLGDKGFQLASALLDDSRRVVAIESGDTSAEVRELSDRGAIVLEEDATRRRTIGNRAKVHLAAEVFVNCGGDRTNAQVVRTVAEWLDDHGDGSRGDTRSVTCHAHVQDRSQRHFLHERFEATPTLRLHTYDTWHATARELLIRRPVHRATPDNRTGRTHVAVVGWNDFSRPLVFELCQTMHYLEDHDRAITIVCRDSDVATRELFERHTALDPDRWDDESVRGYVAELFPDIRFVELPADEHLLLSDQFELYDHLDTADTLTVIVTEGEGFRSGSLVSTILPRLEAIERDLGLDTQVQYFVDKSEGWDRQANTRHPELNSETITLQQFTAFLDDCTPETIRGERRDLVAKQLALFFHLRYEYAPTTADPASVDVELADVVPLDPPAEIGYDYETVTALWNRLSDNRLELLADVVWRHIPEHHRDTNRNAADHVPVKHRLATALAGDANQETIHRRLSAVEHRRWAAEKFLDGWEPLPAEHASRWRTDDAAEAAFREQKYHLDLRPMTDLERLTDGEVEKDVSLVRFVLEQVRVDDRMK